MFFFFFFISIYIINICFDIEIFLLNYIKNRQFDLSTIIFIFIFLAFMYIRLIKKYI